MPQLPRILYIGNKLAAFGRTPTSIDTLGPLLESEGYKVYYAGNRLNQISRLLHMLISIWKHRKNVDVVLIDTYSTSAFNYAWLCGRLSKLLGIKYVPILHGGNLPDRLERSANKCRQLFGNSFMNVAVSAYMYEHMKTRGYKCTIIENSIALENYHYTLRDKAEARLLWVRAFHEIYNPQMAIALVAQLQKKYPDIRLTMVGPDIDGSMDKCMALAAQKELTKSIKFTGKLSKQEWISLSADYDIFINTSNFDNQPVSLVEAMALGMPVVSTNVGGIPYLAEDGKTAVLVNAYDIAAMAHAVDKLINNNAMSQSLSSNGRKKSEQFDWQQVKHKWHKLFASLDEDPV